MNKSCNRCQRLVEYRESIRPKKGLENYPYWNKPVVPFGDENAWLLIVGLAPGAHGANRTSRPFTGDGAGEILYPALCEVGFTSRPYSGQYDSQFILREVMITNAVRCVPPGNKPEQYEFKNCRPYLMESLETESITDILCVGRDAFVQVFKALGVKAPYFVSGLRNNIGKYRIWAIYHTSRYNQNTGRITYSQVSDMIKLIKDTHDKK